MVCLGLSAVLLAVAAATTTGADQVFFRTAAGVAVLDVLVAYAGLRLVSALLRRIGERRQVAL